MPATLSDLAEKYGVSKVTAKARLVSAGLWDGHAHKEGRMFVIDDEAVEELDRLLVGDDQHFHAPGSGRLRVRSGYASDSDVLIAELRETVAYLKQQIDEKDKQIARRDEQIARRDEQINRLIENK